MSYSSFSLPQLLDGLPPEAGQLRVQHELDQVDDLAPVGPDGQIGLHAQLLEALELRGLHPATHDVHELRGQLHVGLEGQVATRGALKHEPEIWEQEKYKLTKKHS